MPKAKKTKVWRPCSSKMHAKRCPNWPPKRGQANPKSTSNVEGDVSTQKLIVEAGATFNAQCKMHSSQEGVKKLNDSHEKTA